MYNLMITALALLLSSAAPAAADTRATLHQIVLDAQKVRAEALEVRQLLGASQPDVTLITERLAMLASHADALKQTIDGFDVAAANLSSDQLAAFERARSAADTLRVLLANKTTLLADGEAARKNRGLLRAKADGIAKRADIVERQMTKIRS